ncbi:molybdenum cofactor cytidylyltransferase [Candidatus Bathyarchaeota archaeon]|nr:molybdenum cofactor cytidylyltransferase [Candidatus Bathyarchaeota archaeon]
MISAILLAAGESSRMGRTKQILKFRESTILQETVRNLLGSKIDELIVVLGHDADKLRRLLSLESRARLVLNQEYRKGIGSSIRCGVQSADPNTEAFLIALADQPLIRTEIIDLLIERYRVTHAGIVAPVYRSIKGHPVIISRKYRNELLKLSGDRGARDLLERHRDDTVNVEVDSPEILQDVDREEDYLRLRRQPGPPY